MEDNTVYFQPPGMRPQYCEAGMISETDPEYIWYLDEPCKILISEVKIIPKEDVIYDRKKRSYLVKLKHSNNKQMTYTKEDMKSFADWCRNALLNTEYSYLKLDEHLEKWKKLKENTSK